MTEAALSADPVGTTVERPSADAVVIERWYPASPALMWKLWTDPAHIVRWWGPDGVTCPQCDIDLRVGGEWTTTMKDPDCNAHRAECRFIEIVPERLLVCSWCWVYEDGPGATSRLSIEFTPEADGCRLRLSHTGLPVDYADKHEEGWTSSLECLSRCLASLDRI